MDIESKESRCLRTQLHVINLAPNAFVSSSKDPIDPSSRPSNHLIATRPRLEGKTLHINDLFLKWTAIL